MANEKPKVNRYWHSDMTYRTIKKLAVELGCPFPEVIGGDFNRLISFIDSERALKKPNPELVGQFDDWLERVLLERGCEYLVKPSLRLGYLNEEKQKVLENAPKPKKEIPKKEIIPRDENNLLKGTKKSYTFKLAKKGLPIDRVIRRVLKQFPDASEKSIRIWFRKAMGISKAPKDPDKVKEVKEKVKRIIDPEELLARKKKAKERKDQRKVRRNLLNQKTQDFRDKISQLKGKKKK